MQPNVAKVRMRMRAIACVWPTRVLSAAPLLCCASGVLLACGEQHGAAMHKHAVLEARHDINNNKRFYMCVNARLDIDAPPKLYRINASTDARQSRHIKRHTNHTNHTNHTCLPLTSSPPPPPSPPHPSGPIRPSLTLYPPTFPPNPPAAPSCALPCARTGRGGSSRC